MRAYLKNYRQSPRKVRVVANLLKGKSAQRALLILDTTPKRATLPLKNLVRSAIANAKQKEGAAANDLFIKEIRVDKGLTMHRYMPKAHGRATRFDKHASNVTLILAESKSNKQPTTNNKQEKTKIKKKATTSL